MCWLGSPWLTAVQWMPPRLVSSYAQDVGTIEEGWWDPMWSARPQCLPCANHLLPSHFHLGFFFKTFFAALEGKLNGAEFINFASAWNNFDAFGMFHPGMQACRPALPSVQVTVSLRSYRRWGIYTCCWDPECSAIYCFPGVWLVLPLLAEVVWGGEVF